MSMIPIRNRWHDQRFELTGSLEQPGKLTAEDIARLSAKREEIIMILRLWHGYGRSVADQALSHWMHHNSRPHAPRPEDFKQA
jgi:hypothetical protein